MRLYKVIVLLLSLLLMKAVSAGLLPIEQDTINVFNKVSPYVVNVNQVHDVVDQYWRTRRISAGTGSGVILNKRGYIVTNYHVLGNSKKFDVTLKTGKTLIADFVGGDPRKDVAILRVRDRRPIEKLIKSGPLKVADSHKLKVGQIAIAIGNPFGLDETLTEGVVSALGRDIAGYGGVDINDMIQTDASINPGNSGGPLLDSQGRLIGLNTMMYSRTGSFSGIGFAIPSNTINKVVSQVLILGKIVTPGIGIIPVPDAVAMQSGVRGVIIAKVISGLPASKAGLAGVTRTRQGHYRAGDIIIAVDGKPVKNYNDLYQILDTKKVGDKVALTVSRDHKKSKVTLKTVNVNKNQ